MAVAASRSRLNVPTRLIARMTWNGSSACGPLLPVVRCAKPVPAQATLMRRPPSASAAASTAACTWSSSRTSRAANRAPRAPAGAAPRSAVTSAVVTPAPRSRRGPAVALGGGLGRRLHLVLVAHDARGEPGDELARERLAAVGVDVGDRHDGDALVQVARRRLTQPGRAAGDERSASLDPHGGGSY